MLLYEYYRDPPLSKNMFLDYQQAQVLVYRQTFHQPATQERPLYIPCQIGDADGDFCCYCWSPSEFGVAPTARERERDNDIAKVALPH